MSVEFPVTFAEAGETRVLSVAPNADPNIAIPNICASLHAESDPSFVAKCQEDLQSGWQGFSRRPCYTNVAKKDLINMPALREYV